VQPRAPVSVSIIRISVPVFYTDSTNRVSVYAIYSGNASQYVTFRLNSPQGVTVYNSIQTVYATPQEEMNRTFEVATGGSTGTLELNLTVTTPGANLTYPMPVFVLEKPQFTISVPPSATGYLLPAGALVAVAVAAYLIISRLRNARKKKADESAMRSIKSQIGRNEAGRKSDLEKGA
jgi:hypothetical protein